MIYTVGLSAISNNARHPRSLSNHSQRLIVDSDTIFTEDRSDVVIVIPFVVLQILGNSLDWGDYIPEESAAAVHSYVQ